MQKCCLCRKKRKTGNGSFFTVPDDDRRVKWSKICGFDFTPSMVICIDHFSPTCLVQNGRLCRLLPNAVPTVPISDEKTTYEERCMPLEQPFRENESVADTHLNMWLPSATEIDPLNIKSFKDQQTQTVGSKLEDSYTMLKQCKEKIRQLETDNKELKCKLAQANLAVDAMRTIFTEGQIRKLMSPGFVHWSWEDITNAIYLHECGPAVYNHLYNKGFPLPHYKTLQRWCGKIDKQTADMSLSEEICTLSFDKNKDEQIFECGSSDDEGTTTSSIGLPSTI